MKITLENVLVVVGFAIFFTAWIAVTVKMIMVQPII